MHIIKRIVIISMMLLCLVCCLCSCGRYISEREMAKIEKKYEEGKVSTAEYLQAVDAYLNNEPLPRKGIIGAIFNFFEKVFLFILGIIVISFITAVFRNKKS